MKRVLPWLAVEALWEVVENSEFVVRRYREETAALGYHGDKILNSLADILVCGLGFHRTFALFVVMEIALAIWIRDSLLLNVLMLIYPIDEHQGMAGGRAQGLQGTARRGDHS